MGNGEKKRSLRVALVHATTTKLDGSKSIFREIVEIFRNVRRERTGKSIGEKKEKTRSGEAAERGCSAPE